MAHVLILQNMSFDGPGYLGTWLRERGCSLDVRNAEIGEPFPASIEPYDALALLGGAMGANDDLPTLRQAEGLFLQALGRGIPTIGHCLGGQLMSRALGASVHASLQPEVGWHAMQIEPVADRWFGNRRDAVVMHWHYDAFDLPRGVGATTLARSAACPVQAWSLGRNLAMQFHVEVDVAKVQGWCDERDDQAEQLRPTTPTIHAPERILQDLPRFLAAQQVMAADVYRRWLGG